MADRVHAGEREGAGFGRLEHLQERGRGGAFFAAGGAGQRSRNSAIV